MLLELKVQNLAVIESIEIKFGNGLNVLTGETGAGKSVLLAALNLVLGERSDRELIRTGKQEAWAEAIFEIDERVAPVLHNCGLSFDPQEPLAIRRSIQVNGRSRAYVNSITVSASILKQLAPLLLDFGQQHEQSLLLNPEKHLEFLDQYGELEKQRAAVEKGHQRVKKLTSEFEELSRQMATMDERLEFLQFQRKSITDIDPQPGEEEELTAEYKRLNAVEECKKLAQRGESVLSGGEGAAREVLSRAVSIVRELTNRDRSLKHVLEDLNNALISVEEAARSLQVYRQNLRMDARRMEEIQERLESIVKLQNRHGGTYESVVKRLEEIDQEIKQIKTHEKRFKEIKPLIAEARSHLLKIALPLSERRKEIAGRLSQEIEKELQDLAMREARFQVQFSSLGEEEGAIACTNAEQPGRTFQVGACGMERASFMLSANLGEQLRPLQNVASGGELSRIMLAIKHALAKVSTVQTFVFDEIDAGVSGNTATLLAQKLRNIAEGNSQVICITHTPQIAAEADHHFHVEKQIANERTNTFVRFLSRQERIHEIARMLSGDQNLEMALELAKDMVRPEKNAALAEGEGKE